MDTKVLRFSDTTTVDELPRTVIYTAKKANKIKERIIENSEVKALKANKKTNIFIKILSDILKRFIDIIASLFGIVLLIPMTGIIYIANKVSKDNGPIFFPQERIGKNGKIFKMYKFRSMVVGADEKLFKYLEENPEAKEEYTKYKKLKNDPRVTKIGEFIRKTSIDEFPQFINVLKGDMSIVGPRPYLPREKDDMGDFYKYIVTKKPGITGPWQVSGRNDVTFDDRLFMDLQYYSDCGLTKDIECIAKTVEKVVKKEGAI